MNLIKLYQEKLKSYSDYETTINTQKYMSEDSIGRYRKNYNVYEKEKTGDKVNGGDRQYSHYKQG
jgi:hypothetical protein